MNNRCWVCGSTAYDGWGATVKDLHPIDGVVKEIRLCNECYQSVYKKMCRRRDWLLSKIDYED